MNEKAEAMMTVTEVVNTTLRERFPDWHKDNVFHDMVDAIITGEYYEKQLQFNGKRVKVVVGKAVFEPWTRVDVRLYDTETQSRVYSSHVWNQAVEEAHYKPEFVLQMVSVIMCGFKKKVLDENHPYA